MKKALIVIAGVLVVGVAGLAGVIVAQPEDFKITRTAKYSAPPEKVFEYVNDLHKWNEWSPWAKLDPNAKNTFEGGGIGKGASFAWDGNDQVGAGKMTITESKPNEVVQNKLEFYRPFESVCTVEFTVKPEGDQTVLTWSMFGKNNFMGKAMGLVMDCDKMVGSQFDQGLDNLRGIVEPKK